MRTSPLWAATNIWARTLTGEHRQPLGQCEVWSSEGHSATSGDVLMDKSLGEGTVGIKKLEASHSAKYRTMHGRTPTPTWRKGIYPAPDLNSAEADRQSKTDGEVQVHRCGQQATLDPQSQHVILTPPFFPPQGHVSPRPPSVCLFLSLPWHWKHITCQVLNTPDTFTALSGGSGWDFMITLCGMSSYDPRFTHQETGAQCR